MARSDAITVLVQDKIAWVKLSRGEHLNALTWEMLSSLKSAFEDLGTDINVRACVLTGSDGAFCAGADVGMMAKLSTDDFRSFCEDIQELTRIVRKLPFPIIAAIDGAAVGAGCEIACLCDVRISTDRGRLGFPEASVGLVVTSGASWLIPRIIGAGRARRLLFTAEIIDAHRAEQIGLVDEVVPVGHLESRAREIADQISASSPAAVTAARALQNLAEAGDIEASMREEVDVISRLKAGEEANEGFASFLEKRKPYWTTETEEGLDGS